VDSSSIFNRNNNWQHQATVQPETCNTEACHNGVHRTGVQIPKMYPQVAACVHTVQQSIVV